MKREELLVSPEWLMRKIAADPDVDTEAGLPLQLADTGPIMMALVELIRFLPRDEKVRKITDGAMQELSKLRAEKARLLEAAAYWKTRAESADVLLSSYRKAALGVGT